ncbi:MAG: methyltransferase domain-containing protein [Ferruginibacter sp.]
MEQQFQDISNKQKASWNKFSSGWSKWHESLNDHMQPASDGIINLLKPGGSQKILDVASGAGEPGFSIAARLTDGKVIMTDLADEMLNFAREHASEKKISNVDFNVCDVSELPFAENSFDAVSCRMGFMFFPDMLLAAKEIFRVLKPGGRFATAVWTGADKNPWLTAIAEPIKRNMQLPDQAAGVPGVFRCSPDGLMKGVFVEAGFKNITESEVGCKLQCGTAERYWQMMNEIAAPIVSALGKADDAMINKIKQEVIGSINEKHADGKLILDGSCLLIYGKK